MRYRETDPLTRVAGILWTAFSLIAVGIGVWAAWNGAHGSDVPDSSSELRHENTGQIWTGLVFVIMGGLSAAFGVALALEREPKRRWLDPRRTGLLPNAKTTIFFLTFLAGGLVLLSGMRVGVFHESPVAIVLALCFLAAGMGGLWAIFKKRRQQRERSLKAAANVAEARERRLAAKRKRS